MTVREKTEKLISFEDCYTAHRITPDTWMVKTKTDDMPFSCDCYLLEGSHWALAIDSGMQLPDIAEYMSLLTDKPILGVLNTHSHFDHTGGNGYFDKVFLHPLAEQGAKTPFGNAQGYKTDYEVTPVEEGSLLELGDRTLEIYEIGAHDLSSIAILDRSRGILFTGDEVESGWCNVGSMAGRRPGQTIERHYQNLLKLKKLYDEDAFQMICPAHHGAPLSKESLLDFLKCDELILAGEEGCPNVPKKCAPPPMPPEARVMIYRTAHICYRVDGIRDDG